MIRIRTVAEALENQPCVRDIQGAFLCGRSVAVSAKSGMSWKYRFKTGGWSTCVEA
jgi:hypothetical protein